MEELIRILNDMDDSIDWENTDNLIDDRIMDSFMVISLISELTDQFDIDIEASEIVPENLNSVEAMWKMITRLQENQDVILSTFIFICFLAGSAFGISAYISKIQMVYPASGKLCILLDDQWEACDIFNCYITVYALYNSLDGTYQKAVR